MNDMMSSVSDWIKMAGATGIGGMMMALFIRFMFKKMTEESAAIQRAGGEIDIIVQLRNEVDRMAALNETLANRSVELQEEIFDIQKEHLDISLEYLKLKAKQRDHCKDCDINGAPETIKNAV